MNRSIIFLFMSVVVLLFVGFIMLASASTYEPDASGDDIALVVRQAAWLGLGIVFAGIAANFRYQRLARWRWWFYGAAIVGLILCFVPHIGLKVNGSFRWVTLEFLGKKDVRLQPSEFAKIALVIALAAWYARHERVARTFRMGFLLPALTMGAVVALIGREVDLGSATITTALGLGIMVAAGSPKRYILASCLVAIIALGTMIAQTPERTIRFKGYMLEIPFLAQFVKLDEIPAEQRTIIIEKKRQQRDASYGMGEGGIEGTGPGLGRMKMYGLAEAHTDFIFPLIGEELGLRGTLAVVLAFVVFVLSGMCIATYAPDRFGKLLAFGLTALTGMEGLMNMGVTTGLLPNKGLPLPFVSYGGSSLLMALVSVGILFNIYRQGVNVSASDLPVVRRRNRWTPQV